jgi:hypothetical protein
MNIDQQHHNLPTHYQDIRKYPLIHTTLATIICQCTKSLHQNTPAYIGIDNINFIQNPQNHVGLSLQWWEKHLAPYFVTDTSLAISSAWIKLNRPSGNDIFGCGTYFYNCGSGSFEIEIDSKGVLANIFGEFNGKTPSFIPELLVDFPKQSYLPDEGLKDEISNNDFVADRDFIEGLEPIPYKIIELD